MIINYKEQRHLRKFSTIAPSELFRTMNDKVIWMKLRDPVVMNDGEYLGKCNCVSLDNGYLCYINDDIDVIKLSGRLTVEEL